jgi:chromate transporter
MNPFFIYFEYLKIGFFAVGGGLATLPFVFQMAASGSWLSREAVGNFLAIAQSSPGPVGVNLASEVGFAYAGISGALLAALGLISPAIVVIVIVARMLKSFRENKIVDAVFSGLRPAAAGLLAAACFGVIKISLYNDKALTWSEMLKWRECIIFAALFLLVLRFKKHPILYIASGAAAGIALGLP